MRKSSATKNTRRDGRMYRRLREALEDALAFERGKLNHLKVTNVAPAPNMAPQQIKAVRKSLRVSQPKFAALLNVSTQAVRSWEQGLRRPRAAALRLLQIASRNPRVLIQTQGHRD